LVLVELTKYKMRINHELEMCAICKTHNLTTIRGTGDLHSSFKFKKFLQGALGLF